MRNRLLLLPLFLFLLPFAASAQWLKKPLRYVQPDSVVTWSYDGLGFKQLAQSIDSTARPDVCRLSRSDLKQRDALLQRWQAGAAERNVVGGDGDAFLEPQGLSAANWAKQAARLFLLQGDATYMDEVERAFYNVVLRTAYSQSLSSASLEKWQAAVQLLNFPALMYAVNHKGDELSVNLYTNATATLPLAGKRVGVDMITNMPLTGGVKIRLTGLAKRTPLTLRLRIPDWAGLRSSSVWHYEGADSLVPTIFVNGHEISPLPVDSKGYVTISRKWQSLDEVYIDFPMQAQYVFPVSATRRTKGQPVYAPAAVLQYGPLVYYPKEDSRGHYFLPSCGAAMEEELTPHSFPIFSGTMYNAAGTPQDAAAPAFPFHAWPYAEM